MVVPSFFGREFFEGYFVVPFFEAVGEFAALGEDVFAFDNEQTGTDLMKRQHVAFCWFETVGHPGDAFCVARSYCFFGTGFRAGLTAGRVSKKTLPVLESSICTATSSAHIAGLVI